MWRTIAREILVPVGAIGAIGIGWCLAFDAEISISRILGVIALACMISMSIRTMLFIALGKKERKIALTSDELTRLKDYLKMAENKNSFTLEQAKDFYQIAQKLLEKRGDADVGMGVWAIGLIARLTLQITAPDTKNDNALSKA